MVPVLTQEGFEKAKKELDYLKTVKRKEISEKIEKAKELGDLSENAEYQEAKEEQGLTEARVVELENLLKTAVVSNGNGNKDQVSIGSEVVTNSKLGEQTFKIVGFNEADPAKGWISNESPLGKSLMGRKKGEKIAIEVPAGTIEYEILEIK